MEEQDKQPPNGSDAATADSVPAAETPEEVRLKAIAAIIVMGQSAAAVADAMPPHYRDSAFSIVFDRLLENDLAAGRITPNAVERAKYSAHFNRMAMGAPPPFQERREIVRATSLPRPVPVKN